MCTVIKLEDKDKPLIAKKDIKVYKSGSDHNNFFVSEYQYHRYSFDFLYITNFTYQENIGIVSDGIEHNYRLTISYKDRIFVIEGFHSFATLKRTKKSDLRYNCKIGLFIIPKGASYYRNGCDNVVSNQIIFKKFI